VSRPRLSDAQAVEVLDALAHQDETWAKTVSERSFQAAVERLARLGGWCTFHDRTPKRNNKGFPDLVMVHPTRGLLVVAELKTAKGRVRPEQKTWLAALQLALKGVPTATVALWRPSDYPHISALLLGPSTGTP
jgi:hypothetical protein